MKNKSIFYLLVSTITFVTGYVFLKLAYYDTSETPFTQEIILIVLGTIATIAITAALLNKQSEIELEKEQRVKVFDIKADLYFELINFIEDLIKKNEIDSKDLITLEFLTHKISVIANPEVLSEYSNFVQTVKNTSTDTKITALESDEMSGQLAKLCGKIRYDLIHKEKDSNIDVQKIIDNNIKKI
jgi:hypothetical protein